MRLPVISGIIRRRLLLNYRVDPDVAARQMPDRFQPKLQAGHAIAGVCLIRLEQVRPRGLPAFAGVASENGAHRIAVTWTDDDGLPQEGVYVPRRDTGSRLNWLAGGRVFPGEHSYGRFQVDDDGSQVRLRYQATDGLSFLVKGHETDEWPADSCFESLAESSRFFESGSIGYSKTRDCCRVDGLALATADWRVRPFAVDDLEVSWFDDKAVFPRGSATFDHGLVMRNITHEWHAVEPMRVTVATAPACVSAVREI